MRKAGTDQVHRGGQVDRESLAPGLDEALGEEWRDQAGPGVVHQDVDPAESIDRLADDGLDALGIGHVEDPASGASSRGLYLLDYRLHAVCVHIGDDHRRALVREQVRRGAPDAARGARHEGDLALDRTAQTGQPRH